MIAFVNIQHSGTGFVMQWFHYDHTAMENPNARERGVRLAFTHVSDENVAWLDRELPLYEGWFTVTRSGIEESWRKRRLDLTKLEAARQAWRYLVSKHRGLVLDLDDEDGRQGQLDELNRRFNLQLTTDWSRKPSLSPAR